LSRSNALGIAALLLLLLGIAGISLVSDILAFIVGAVACAAVGYRSLLEMSRIGFLILPARLMRVATRRRDNER